MGLACGPNAVGPADPVEAIEVDLTFVRFYEERTELVGVRLDDGAETTIASVQGELFAATPRAWSFDGSSIALGRSDGVVVLDAAGNEQRVIAGAYDAEWSPVERKLAYRRALEPVGEELRVLDFDDGRDRVAHAILGFQSSTWTPDGQLLVAVNYAECALWKIDLSSDDRSCILEAAGVEAISAGADRIAFVAVEQLAENSTAWPLYVMRSDGSDPQRRLDNVSPLSRSSWSADGSLLAAERISKGGSPLVVTVVQADGVMQSTYGPSSVEPVYAPEGNMLAFLDTGEPARVVVVEGEDEIWRSSLPPETTRQYERFPAWRPR